MLSVYRKKVLVGFNSCFGANVFHEECAECRYCCCDTDHDGDVHVQSETDLGLTDECGDNCGHEGCGDGCDPVHFCFLGKVYCGSPENEHGQALVGEAEVSPDCGEVLGGDNVAQDKQGDCYKQTFDSGPLIHFEGFRYDKSGGAKAVSPLVMGRITTAMIAKMPPTGPSREFATSDTTAEGEPAAITALSASGDS